jgi:hypothetical protein
MLSLGDDAESDVAGLAHDRIRPYTSRHPGGFFADVWRRVAGDARKAVLRRGV